MIQHVALEVRRERAHECARFYALLGFRQVHPPDSLRERALWVERGGTQVHLLYVDDARPLTRGHVAVVVEDWDATVALVSGKGYEVEPRRPHWGSPRAYVRDPAGNLVELMAFPPTAPQDCSAGLP